MIHSPPSSARSPSRGFPPIHNPPATTITCMRAMADPLSLESSIASLIAVGTKISSQLHQFTNSAPSTPSDIYDLAVELTDLCSILKRLQNAVSGNSGAVHHRELWLGFRNVLASCMDKFVQLRMLVNAHEIDKGDETWCRTWRCWNRTFQEREVTLLKVQLEAHKATLNITLLLSDEIEPTSIKDTADMIETTARDIIGRLAEESDGETTSTKYQDSSILQRYLNSASSVVSSRTASPIPESTPLGEKYMHSKETAEPQIQSSPTTLNTPITVAKKISLLELRDGGKRSSVVTPSSFRSPSSLKPPPMTMAQKSVPRSSRAPQLPRNRIDLPSTLKPQHVRTLSLPSNKTLPRPSTPSTPRSIAPSTKIPSSTSHSRTASLPSNKVTSALSRPPPLPPPSPTTTLFAKLSRSKAPGPQKTIENTDFAEEINRVYNEPPDRCWCHPDETRKKCIKEQESTICTLYLETLGDQRDMEKTKAMFKQKEAWMKLKTSSERFETACARIFTNMWFKLQEGVTRLANMYKYFELVNDNSTPADTTAVWVAILMALLRELLGLRKKVEARHERVLGLLVERDVMYTRATKTITQTLFENGVIGRDLRSHCKDTKLVARQFELTLEYAQQSFTDIAQSVLTGLDLGLSHIEKVVDATKDIIPAFGIVSRGMISPKNQLQSDPKVLYELRLAAGKLMEGFQRVAHVLSLGTMEVARGEARVVGRAAGLEKKIQGRFEKGL